MSNKKITTDNEINDILMSIGKSDKKNNNIKKDNIKKDNIKKDNVKKDNVKKDNIKKDNIKKDNIKKDNIKKDNIKKDNDLSDNGLSDNNSNDNLFKKNGYSRPEITFTDQLSKEQIEEKLEDYIKVDDISKIPLGVHLRYFTNKDNKLNFRMGGILHKNTGLPKYVILKSATNAQWSVQIENTIFYKKMTIVEIKDEYEKIISELIQKNKKLKDKIKQLQP
jgi:pentapeptide MXKDX repeat protein